MSQTALSPSTIYDVPEHARIYMFIKKIEHNAPRFKSADHLRTKAAGPPSTMSREELRRIVAEMVG